MKNLILFTALFAVLFSSCYVNRTTVGYGPVGESLHSRTYSKVKQRYVLFGLIPINRANPKMPPQGVGFELKSGYNIEDAFLTLITVGLYGQRTVKILVEKEIEQDIKLKQDSQKNGH